MAKDAVTSEIMLDGRMDASAAEALHAEILDKRGDTGGLVINGSNVSLIDTPAIQVLMSAAHDQAEREESFRLSEPSEEMSEAMTLLGLADEFKQWSSADV
jgi:anti-anti-sigma factor